MTTTAQPDWMARLREAMRLGEEQRKAERAKWKDSNKHWLDLGGEG